jgi:hypothetical protein
LGGITPRKTRSDRLKILYDDSPQLFENHLARILVSF